MNAIVTQSLRTMWRHRKMMYWVFLVSLVFAFISSRSINREIGRVLNTSLASRDLVYGFDLARFDELTKSPEVNFSDSAPVAFTLSLVFLAYMLFITGGILQTYREDRRLGIGEFFDACGHHFWRFLRLMLLSLIPFGIAALIGREIRALGTLAGESSRAMILSVGAAAIVTFVLVLLVRLWFDVAQVRAVAQDEHIMLRNLFRSAKITRNQVAPLLWIYFRISLLAWVSLAVCGFVWMKFIPPNQWLLSFLVLELMIFAQLATRFWQRAAAVNWYERFAEEKPELAADLTTSKPQEIYEI